uniref:Putative conserved secreted protein n=1 Tax=Aedes albopictus TaxID=7160 RepID=A0A1W7R740_AEDAL
MKIFILYCIVAFGALAFGNPIDSISDGNVNLDSDSDVEEQLEGDTVPFEDVEGDENEELDLFSIDDVFQFIPDEELLEDASSDVQDVLVDDFLDADTEQEDELEQDPQVPQELQQRPFEKPLRLCALPPLYLGQKPQMVPAWWCQCPKGVIC